MTRTIDEYVNVEPRFTPQENQIFFRKIWNPGADIYSMDIEGAQANSVIKGDVEDFALSPSGDKLAFSARPPYITVEDKIALLISDTRGKGLKMLTNYTNKDTRPCWSNDNKKIVFMRGEAEGAEIYIVPENQATLQRLTRNNSYDGDPVWQP